MSVTIPNMGHMRVAESSSGGREKGAGSRGSAPTAGVSATVRHHMPATPPELHTENYMTPGGKQVGTMVASVPGYAEGMSHANPVVARSLADDDIWHAARRGDAAAVEKFVRGGVLVGTEDECGRSPAYYASLYGHDKLGSLLRDYEARQGLGVDVKTQGSSMSASAREEGRKAAESQRKFEEHAARGNLALQSAGSSIVEQAPMAPKPKEHSSSRPPSGRASSARHGGELLEAHHRLARDRAAVRRRRLRALERQQMFEDLEIRQSRWMDSRKMKKAFEFSRSQKKELKQWFDFIDADGSGEINVEELQDPLLSTGIARNTGELQKLIDAVDTDGSGEIGFDEFLAVLKPRNQEKKRKKRKPTRVVAQDGEGEGEGELDDDKANAFKALQEQLNDKDQLLPLQMMITVQRRKFLLETIVGDPKKEEEERTSLAKAEEDAVRTDNAFKLAQVRKRQREKQMEKSKRGERLSALQAVVDRNRRRAAADELARQQEEMEKPPEVHHEEVKESKEIVPVQPSKVADLKKRGGAKVDLTQADKSRLAELRSARDRSTRAHARPKGEGRDRKGKEGGVRLHQLNSGGGMQYNPRPAAERGDIRKRSPSRTKAGMFS